MSKPDEHIMMDFCNAAAEALQAGLQHTRREDPHLYREIAGLVAGGLFHPELVVRFKPLTVQFRIVGEVEPGDKPMTIDIFAYGGGDDDANIH